MVNKISLINTPEQTDLSNIIVLTSIRGSTQTSFIVDTGSPSTIIPFQKARELNLPISDLRSDEDVALLGTRHNSYRFSRPIRFTFLCEDGESISKEFNPLIVKPIIGPKGANPNKILTDAIIGLDFLEHTGWILFCDIKKRQAYLEISNN